MIKLFLYFLPAGMTFKVVFDNLIRDILGDFGEVEVDELLFCITISFFACLLWPVTVVAYVIYKFAKGYAESISRRHQ